MKRLSDIFFASVLLILLLPFAVLTSILIFLLDFRSPLFLQERIGQNKSPFTIIKFRTMLDGKITFFGKVLRKTGIDEIPQLINIVKGDMSFVGPRPLTKADIDRLQWNDPYYNKRWNLKPGIVGLAQLSPVCHKKMSWYLDKYYINEHTFGLDMKILTSSFLIPFVGKSQMKKWMHNR